MRVMERDLRSVFLAIDAAEVAIWSWDVDTDKITLDKRGCDLWDVPEDQEVSFADLSAKIYPPDQDRVKAAFIGTRAIAGRYEIDFRIIVKTQVRWLSARGQGSDANISHRKMFGIFLDVTGRKLAEEGNELLAGEMSHRVKNLLMVATALTAVTADSSTSTKEMARDLSRRLMALGRAHDLVRPAPSQKAKAALLGDLLTVLLAPYDETGAFSGRIRVSVPRLGVDENAATNLALVVHELATNSIKYGALSTKTGALDVSCPSQENEHVVLVWTERGGPHVPEKPDGTGYGSKLITRSMHDLGGSIEINWDEAGVIATLRMTTSALVGNHGR